MADGAVRKGGKKGRKIGRKFKKPSHQRYTAEKRWIKNKARSIMREMTKKPNYKCPDNASAEVKAYIKTKMKRVA